MKNILVMLAHNDDEFFLYEVLKRNQYEGNNIKVAYFTEHSKHNHHNTLRPLESQKSLKGIVPSDNIIRIGEALSIADGELINHIEEAYMTTTNTLQNTPIDTVYTLAWEGGHHDHDAVHLITMALHKKLRFQEVYEFPLYNGAQLPPPFFNVMKFPSAVEKELDRSIKLKFSQAISNLLILLNYKTQYKTFLGLFIGISYQFFIKRKIALRKVQGHNYLTKPHSGALLYESRFKIPFDIFLNKTYNFTTKYIQGHNNE